jgi:homoaconitate hydratase
MPQNLIEKIAERFAVDWRAGRRVRASDFLSIRPAHVMTHDNTAAVIPKFESMGANRIFDSRQPVFALDHDIQNTSPENLEKYRLIESFARRHEIDFYPAGRGIGHQVMVEEGYVLPGSFVVGSDSHSNLYGAVAALGTPVVRTDAAAIWATGRTWWQVPDVVRVCLDGQLAPGASPKDVIIALVGTFNRDEVLNCCIEFSGSGVASLSMEGRMAIANMTTEWGALAGVFPYDDLTREYLRQRADQMQRRGDTRPRLTAQIVGELDANARALQADNDAFYAKDLTLDLSTVTPHVAGPNEVKTIVPLSEIEQQDVRIDKAFLLSCVNGRLEDFAEAARILGGHKVAPHVTLYIAAASSEVEEQATRLGYWQTLLSAGAVRLPPGCGPCIGLGEGILQEGEVGISATNRNFRGRMGSRDAEVYLSSPAVVAASAIRGTICGPGAVVPTARRASRVPQPVGREVIHRQPAAGPVSIDLMAGFPHEVRGELLWVPKDNLNTDGIYGKDYTYQEGMTPEEMGTKAMLNYDPQFQQLARFGDILVGGYNFGSGSSREQAATALKFRGLQLVIAGSFSQTYSRNAFNNGYIVVTCPALVDFLRSRFAGDPEPTIRTGLAAVVDFVSGKVATDGREFTFTPLGTIAQELIVKGGFEAVIRDQLAEMNRNAAAPQPTG